MFNVTTQATINPTSTRAASGLLHRRATCCAITAFAALLCVNAQAATDSGSEANPASKAQASAENSPPEVALLVNLGFSHWYGNTLGTPAGASTPALVIGVNPGTSLLELRVNYSVSLSEFELPDGLRSRIGFLNADILVSHELKIRDQSMVMGFGPTLGFVHGSRGLGPCLGLELSARYLLEVAPGVALGPVFDVRAQYYGLPDEERPLFRTSGKDAGPAHSDLQSQLGVALRFF